MTLRLRPPEHERLRAAAKLSGRTIADLVREAALEAARRELVKA